jgi:hypothetical protein
MKKDGMIFLFLLAGSFFTGYLIGLLAVWLSN